jgi:hypothetical protein
MKCPNDDNCRVLERLQQDVSRILAILQPKKCSQADLEQLGRLIPAIGGYLGDRPFSVWELLIDPALAAIAPSPSGTGTLLSRAQSDRVEIDGLQVEKLGRIHNATKWRLTRRLVYGDRGLAENGSLNNLKKEKSK